VLGVVVSPVGAATAREPFAARSPLPEDAISWDSRDRRVRARKRARPQTSCLRLPNYQACGSPRLHTTGSRSGKLMLQALE